MQDDDSVKEKSMPFDDGTVPSIIRMEDSALIESGLNLEVSSDRQERALIGQIIDDKFKIIDVLGRGGMSVVYKALWVVLNKVVAVKTMHSHLVSDTNALMRFKQEAQATIALEHPNVVKVYQFGITGGDDSKPYIVMDFIEGESLSERLKRKKRMPVKETLQIFAQVCNALEHAHKKGVIHRDLKPSNIMLLHKDGELPNIKIVDFGIAKILPQEGEAAHRLTQTGDIFGSPMYMSPEQCMGRVVDIRSDVYAIGCVLYETLSGSPPHMGNNVFETFHKHISVIPASLTIPDTDKSLLDRLDAMVFRALEKEPEKRFQSMAQFEFEINEILLQLDSGLRGTDFKMGLARQQRVILRMMHSAPRMVLIIAALSMLLGVGISFLCLKTSWFFQSHKFAAAPTRWIEYLNERRKKSKLTDEEKRKMLDDGQLASYFSLLQHEPDSLHVAEQLKERARRCAEIDAPAEEIAARAKVIEIFENKGMADLDYIHQAELYAECLLNQGDLQQARHFFERVEFLREKARMDNTPKIYILLGYVYSRLAFDKATERSDERTAYVKKALEQYRRANLILSGYDDDDDRNSVEDDRSSSDYKRSAIVYALRGDMFRLLGNMKRASESYSKAEKTLANAHSDKNKPLMKEFALYQGYVNLEMNKFDVARNFYGKAYSAAKDRFEHEPDLLEQFLDQYAVAAWNTGNFPLAISLHEEASKGISGLSN